MQTITSVSGGKTSSYMAIKFPTDYRVFAVVLTKDPKCVIKDKTLRRYCQEKLPQFDWNKGGSRELDLTLANMRELEQDTGRIDWVAAPFTYEDVISCPPHLKSLGKCYGTLGTAYLPNSRTRTCTQAMKVYPIFWHCWLNLYDGDPIFMNIGYRWDEQKRIAKWGCDAVKAPLYCDIEGQFKAKHRWKHVHWRITRFPLWEDRIDHNAIKRFWQRRGREFPRVSNCDGCFFHRNEELQYQAKHYPERMQWWQDQEEKLGTTFAETSVAERLKGNGQLSLDLGDLGACHCTD